MSSLQALKFSILVCALPLLLQAQDDPFDSIFFDPVAIDLTLPVSMAFPDDGSGWMFVVEQVGRVRLYDGLALQPTPFLDISDKVVCCGEDGLLDIAFHPLYAQNGLFYVSYIEEVEGVNHTVIARYRALPGGRFADAGSELRMFRYPRPTVVHNSGELEFGPDGYLYISSGDGGEQTLEATLVAQRADNLFGKILRIDVDGGEPYSIPPTNPLVGVEGAREEIWALGLRNPWRFSFDRETNEMWIGEVGSGLIEEINVMPAVPETPPNFGWPYFEGNGCSPLDPNDCTDGGFVFPVIAIDRQEEACSSITGGVRYRGAQMPALTGRYFFADWCTGSIWAAKEEEGGWSAGTPLKTRMQISTFGQDRSNELYLADHTAGVVYRVRSSWPRPELTGVSPTVTAAGGSPFRMSVSGANFGTRSKVRIDGREVATQFLSPHRLAATFNPVDLAAGEALVTVVNPQPNEGSSEAAAVTVLEPGEEVPSVLPEGVVHGATFRFGAVSPGQTVSVFGEGLAATAEAVATLPLPTSLGGATVRLADGSQAPLLFASPEQINFLLPWEIPAERTVTIQVETGGRRSEPFQLETNFVSPGIFSVDQSGGGQAAVLIAGEGVLAAPAGSAPGARPAKAGDYLEIYVTGLGDVIPRTPVEEPAPGGVVAEVREMPVVFLGGVQAPVLFAGRAPGFVGLYQINIQVPEGTQTGDDTPLAVAAKGVTAPELTIAVER